MCSTSCSASTSSGTSPSRWPPPAGPSRPARRRGRAGRRTRRRSPSSSAARTRSSSSTAWSRALLALDYPADRLEAGRRRRRVGRRHRRAARRAGPPREPAAARAAPPARRRRRQVRRAERRPSRSSTRRDRRRLRRRPQPAPNVAAPPGPALPGPRGRRGAGPLRHPQRRRVDAGPTRRVDYLSGYLVNEYGRQALFELPAYGGANCAVRMSTLRALGGWNDGQRHRGHRPHAAGAARRPAGALRRHRGRHEEARRHRSRRFWTPALPLGPRPPAGAGATTARPVLRTPHLSLAREGRDDCCSCSSTTCRCSRRWPAAHRAARRSASATAGLRAAAAVGAAVRRPVRRAGRRPARRPGGAASAWSLLGFLPAFALSIWITTRAYLDGMLGRPYAWVKTTRSGATSTVDAALRSSGDVGDDRHAGLPALLAGRRVGAGGRPSAWSWCSPCAICLAVLLRRAVVPPVRGAGGRRGAAPVRGRRVSDVLPGADPRVPATATSSPAWSPTSCSSLLTVVGLTALAVRGMRGRRDARLLRAGRGDARSWSRTTSGWPLRARRAGRGSPAMTPVPRLGRHVVGPGGHPGRLPADGLRRAADGAARRAGRRRPHTARRPTAWARPGLGYRAAEVRRRSGVAGPWPGTLHRYLLPRSGLAPARRPPGGRSHRLPDRAPALERSGSPRCDGWPPTAWARTPPRCSRSHLRGRPVRPRRPRRGGRRAAVGAGDQDRVAALRLWARGWLLPHPGRGATPAAHDTLPFLSARPAPSGDPPPRPRSALPDRGPMTSSLPQPRPAAALPPPADRAPPSW